MWYNEAEYIWGGGEASVLDAKTMCTIVKLHLVDKLDILITELTGCAMS